MRLSRILSTIFFAACALVGVDTVRADEKAPCPGFAALVLDPNISAALKARFQAPPNPIRMQLGTGASSEVPAWSVKPLVAEARESVYPLGQGQAGGKVSKVVPWDGATPYVRKEYFTESSFQNDVRGLSYLREVLGAGSTVKVAKTLEVRPPKTLHLEFIEGKTLNDVLMDARSSEGSKIPARRAYIEMILQLRQAIATRPEVTNIQVVTVSELGGMQTALKFQALVRDADGTLTSTNVFIKSDNILVEQKTGRLVLIDPL